MQEVSRISNVDNRNTYNSGTVRKTSGNEFSTYLGETKSMDEIFQQAADQYNIPVDLLKAIGKAESNFNSKAVSRCGAQGVMQLMPATAKELGVTDSFDAEQNIMGGAKYIAGLLKKYEGDTSLALAAYNAGSGNVAKYNGIPPFEETRNYVKKVMGYYGQGNVNITDNTVSAEQNRTVLLTVPPVQRNLAAFFTNSSASGSNTSILSELFSYDDYIKFLDLFLDNEEEKEEQV